MGHLHTDMTVRGSKADVELKNVLIDTGATYTVLPEKVLEGVGAWGPVGEVEIELGNGEKVKAKAYGVAIKIEEVEVPSISISFESAQTVIGVETLESIGLKLDPTTGRLEFTRPKGLAYFYSCGSSPGWRRFTDPQSQITRGCRLAPKFAAFSHTSITRQ